MSECTYFLDIELFIEFTFLSWAEIFLSYIFSKNVKLMYNFVGCQQILNVIFLHLLTVFNTLLD